MPSISIRLLAIVLTATVLASAPAWTSININVDAVQKAVVFLYGADESGAVDKNRPIGTGFLVAIPTKSDPNRAYHVLVTARHMVDPAWAKCGSVNPRKLYARINRRSQDGGPAGVGFVPVGLEEGHQPTWRHHKDDDIDAAVVPFSGDLDGFDVGFIRVSEFPTDQELKSQTIGDPIMSAGLLPGLQGNSRNYPIFKFGQISNIPSEDVETHCGANTPAFPVKVWLIAANLVPGNSGSPIFHVPLGGYGIVIGGTRATVLGVQSISFLGADVAGMTPINFVYEIFQALDLPDADLRRSSVSVAPTATVPSQTAKPVPVPTPGVH